MTANPRNGVAITSDGTRIAVLSGPQLRVAIGDWGGTNLTEVSFGRDVMAYCLAFVPETHQLVVGLADESIWGFDCDRRVLVHLGRIQGGATAIAVSSDGRMVVAGSADGHLEVYEIRSRREIATFHAAHDTFVEGVSFSPCGERIASWCSDIGPNDQVGYAKVRVYRLASGVR